MTSQYMHDAWSEGHRAHWEAASARDTAAYWQHRTLGAIQIQ